MSQEFLESFLVNDEDMLDELKRSSNTSYEMFNEKYMVRRAKKEPMLQYANLYFLRLQKLKPALREAAIAKWITPLTKSQSDADLPEIVDNILDMKQKKTTIIIGTFYKEQQKKPTILDNIMGCLPTKDQAPQALITTSEDLLKPSQQEDKDKVLKADIGVIEDRSGRINVTGSEVFDIHSFVSGSVLALKGKAIDGGYFIVEDFCTAGLTFNPDIPKESLIGQKRDLYDFELMKDPSKRNFVAFASGLDFGAPGADKAAEFIATFLRGELFGVINTPDG